VCSYYASHIIFQGGGDFNTSATVVDASLVDDVEEEEEEDDFGLPPALPVQLMDETELEVD
jgi:hypothetical protein